MGSAIPSVAGTWQLDRFEIEPTGGPRRAWGTNAHGLLIYAASGHMSVSINKDVVKESENPLEDIFDSILFYAGTYSVEGSLIRHKVTEASDPSRIGREMIRYAQFSSDSVTLATPEESWGRAVLTWRRIA